MVSFGYAPSPERQCPPEERYWVARPGIRWTRRRRRKRNKTAPVHPTPSRWSAWWLNAGCQFPPRGLAWPRLLLDDELPEPLEDEEPDAVLEVDDEPDDDTDRPEPELLEEEPLE